MFLILDGDLLSSLRRSLQGDRRAAVHGRWVDENDCMTLVGPDDAGVVGIAVRSEDWRRRPALVGRWLGKRDLVLVVDEDPEADPIAFRASNGDWESVGLDVVRPVADYNRRHQGLFDVGYLRNKTVTIVGLGSGGGMVADQLARCGVGNFRLVDFDRLETHNIARHVCDMRDLGRLKTVALADRLHRISPFARAQIFSIDVLSDPDRLGEAIDGADLVIAATDSEASKSLINRMAWQRGIPSLFGAAYNRGFGGDVFRSMPPDGACYRCMQTAMVEVFEEAPRASEIDYASVEDPSRFVAEPGLGLDVAFISLLLTKASLLTLLRGTQSTLPDYQDNDNYLMWGNQAEWIFDHPYQALFMQIDRQPACEICDPEGYRRLHLGEDGPTAEQIDARAAELLAGAEPAPRLPRSQSPQPE